MGRHIIVGAGPVGTATAEHLLSLGHEVRMVTRSGSGPSTVERIAADATDAAHLTSLAAGADAPSQHPWVHDDEVGSSHRARPISRPRHGRCLDRAKNISTLLIVFS